MFCLLRWWKNPKNNDVLISRTLGKICFLNDRLKMDPTKDPPKENEFWVCNILFETKVGNPQGCFVCDPVHRMEQHDLIPLSHLSCTINFYERSKSAVVFPVMSKTAEDQFIGWYLPLDLKRHIMETTKAISAIVNLGGEWWASR